MPRLTSVFASSCLLAAALYACTGDDPAPVSSAAPDGGAASSSGGSSSSSGGTSSSGAPATPTCAGQKFDVQKKIKPGPPADGGADGWKPERLRLHGGNVYFSARINPNAGYALYRAPWTSSPDAGDIPEIGPATQVVDDGPTNDVEGESSGILSRDVADETVFLIFEHLSPATPTGDKYNLRYALKPAGGSGPTLDFVSPSNFQEILNGDVNDRTAWLVGTPQSTAMYWSRSTNGGPFRIARAPIKPRAGSEPEVLEKPVLIPLECPVALNCDAPVLTQDERHLLYATTTYAEAGTQGELKDPETYEVALTAEQKADGAVVKHDEVGRRYPSWISDDGCEAIFGNGEDNIYARRAPK